MRISQSTRESLATLALKGQHRVLNTAQVTKMFGIFCLTKMFGILCLEKNMKYPQVTYIYTFKYSQETPWWFPTGKLYAWFLHILWVRTWVWLKIGYPQLIDGFFHRSFSDRKMASRVFGVPATIVHGQTSWNCAVFWGQEKGPGGSLANFQIFLCFNVYIIYMYYMCMF